VIEERKEAGTWDQGVVLLNDTKAGKTLDPWHFCSFIDGINAQ
jgi:hypothetical protein